jgi:ribonuclease III
VNALKSSKVTSKAREDLLHELIANLHLPLQQIDTLNRALTHSSYANEHKLSHEHHNERLEFLGDAVLDLIIGEYLFTTYPEMTEGELTRLKACTVCEGSLAECSRTLELGKYLRLGRGERHCGGANRNSILADTFEAVLGAIYLECGYEVGKQFVLSHLHGYMNMALSGKVGKDFKTLLQELVQQKGECVIRYHVVDEHGPDHDKFFTMEVVIDGVPSGVGSGRNKKIAAQAAAQEAYEKRLQK